MLCCIRRAIIEKISSIVKQNEVYHELKIPSRNLQKTLKFPVLYWVPTAKLDNDLIQHVANLDFRKDFVKNVSTIPATEKAPAQVAFELQPQAFVETLLQGHATLLKQQKGNLVFEYSSPNIAKPFHMGHLRSTIIGNALANIHEHLGYNVTKVNYLGDWGTQFGMLQVGVDLQGVTDEQMSRQPIETLYHAYVTANAASKSDPSILEKARRYFTELENGTNLEKSKQWQKYRNYTIAELSKVYERLGVQFDHYEWESQYSQEQIGDVISALHKNSLLLDEHDGRKIVQVEDRRVPIIKSDGSTLYLARDIAALVDRFGRFNFEHIYYVVDNAQTDHFKALFTTTAALLDTLTLQNLTHIKFGRINGMSTRSGNAVFLRDVLDEARDIMLEKQLQSPTTKVNLIQSSDNYKNVADILGVTAVVINDLKQRRQRDYDFSWDKALQVKGDTGIKLQYTHCRLYSLLEQTVDISLENVSVTMELLLEPEAQDLIFEIARFEDSVWMAKQELEPCILVNYLFGLCNSTSRALKTLKVKSESCLLKQQNRIYLFKTAKDVLYKGMIMLGLRPLNQM